MRLGLVEGTVTTEIRHKSMAGWKLLIVQPLDRDGGPDGGEGDGGDAPPYEYYDDVPALAAWLVETLSPEALAAFKDDPAAAVVEFAGTPAGDDLTSLLIYLQ